MQSTHYALQNAKNATVILNPSPLPSASEIREFPWHKVDWLVVNETEAEGLYLSMKGTEGMPPPSVSTRETLTLLSAQPLFKETNIVCTLGADGVLAFIPTFHRPSTHEAPPSFIYLPAAKLRGEIRDSTGAGDCFTGYFAQGLMEFGPHAVVGKDIKELDITRILKRCVYVSVRALGVFKAFYSFFRQQGCQWRSQGRLTVYQQEARWRSEWQTTSTFIRVLEYT